MSVAFFDLDRTLIDCNSGRLWVAEEWRAGNVGVRDVIWASWWLLKYSLGSEDGLDHVFDVAVERLRDLPESDMDRRVRDWFAREVEGRLRPGATEVLDSHRAAGDRLVVCTSSSAYAARAAMEAFGLDDAISSLFEVRDGSFTGRVEVMAMGAGKLDLTVAWARENGVDLAECAFYTDSHTDLPLLEAVGRPVVVNPDRPLAKVAAERGWPVRDWGRSQ